MTLNTGANPAFSATGGGTVTTSATTSTLTTTTGTALNVTNATIGSAGLMFRSISANGAPSGIVLNNTGASGGLTVTGTGTPNSGGTIQNTTGPGIALTNTLNPSFTSVTITNTARSGISGTQVNSFRFINGTIGTSGTGGTVDDSNIAFNTNTGGTETNLTGTVVITGNTLTNAAFHGIDIFNYNGTLADVTITGNTITSATAAASSKGSGLRLIAFGSASTVANVTKASLSNNTISNFPSGAGIVAQGGNADVGGPAGTFGTAGSPTNLITISGNTIRGESQANPMGTYAIQASVNGRGQGSFAITGNGTVANPLTNITGNVISHAALGQVTVTSTISNNVIVANHTPNLLGSYGISVGAASTFGSSDAPNLTTTIANNAVSQTDANGIIATARDSNGTLNAKIQNNTVAAPLGGTRPGIRIDSGSANGDTTVCLNISGNISAGSNGTQGIGLRKQGTNPNVNTFAINGMAATASPGVENYVNGLNPAGGGTLLISATSGFSNCSLP